MSQRGRWGPDHVGRNLESRKRCLDLTLKWHRTLLGGFYADK